MSTTSGDTPTDQQLLEAIHSWDSGRWDEHFKHLNLEPAGLARYGNTIKNNIQQKDVLKTVLGRLSKWKCWWQGGSCRDSITLPRDAQIDHVVPKSADLEIIKHALSTSRYQKRYFDVHDPGNLAYICGPCNQEKGEKYSEYSDAPSFIKRRGEIEKRRRKVIRRVTQLHSALEADAHTLITSMDISTPAAQEAYCEIILKMIFKLNQQRGGIGVDEWSAQMLTLEYGVEVTLTDRSAVNVIPSGDYLESLAVDPDAEFDAMLEQRYYDSLNNTK